MDEVRVERILRAVECIPAGRLATYGDVGKVVGESPRIVGNIMAQWGNSVPWWRVCNAKGEIPGHFAMAFPHWKAENYQVSSTGVVLKNHRITLEDLERDWAQRIQDLHDYGSEMP